MSGSYERKEKRFAAGNDSFQKIVGKEKGKDVKGGEEEGKESFVTSGGGPEDERVIRRTDAPNFELEERKVQKTLSSCSFSGYYIIPTDGKPPPNEEEEETRSSEEGSSASPASGDPNGDAPPTKLAPSAAGWG